MGRVARNALRAGLKLRHRRIQAAAGGAAQIPYLDAAYNTAAW